MRSLRICFSEFGRKLLPDVHCTTSGCHPRWKILCFYPHSCILLQYVGLENLIQRNEKLYGSGNAPSGGVALPFILVQVDLLGLYEQFSLIKVSVCCILKLMPVLYFLHLLNKIKYLHSAWYFC